MSVGKIAILAASLSVIGTSNSFAQWCNCWVDGVPPAFALNVFRGGVVGTVQNGQQVRRYRTGARGWSWITRRPGDYGGLVLGFS
jgi:hypothetical protein